MIPQSNETCKKHDVPQIERWYIQTPDGAIANEAIKVLREFDNNTDCEIEKRRTDVIAVALKAVKKCMITDVAVAVEKRIKQEEDN